MLAQGRPRSMTALHVYGTRRRPRSDLWRATMATLRLREQFGVHGLVKTRLRNSPGPHRIAHSCTATRTTSTRPGDSARARIRCSIPRAGRASFLTAVSCLRACSEYDHADSRTTARGRVRPRGAPVVRSPAGYWTRVARLLVEAGIPVRVGRRPTHPEIPVSCRNARFVVLVTGRGAVGPISARN